MTAKHSSTTEESIDINQKLCNLDHQIFDMMSVSTRRNILRLISCEHNYGNQLAKYLNVSNPTAHKHLGKLVEEGIINEQQRTTESYSGHRGGEAVLYNISRGITLNLAILPNLIHAHVIETNPDGSIKENEPIRQLNYEASDDKSNKAISRYNQISKQTQQLNIEILTLESQLMEKMKQKNELMGELDTLLSQNKLNFRQRIILRALACLGPGCYDDIAAILGSDPKMIEHYMENLSDYGWIKPIE